MWQRFDSYIKAIWIEYKIWGFVLIFVLLLGAAWIFGVDLGGFVNAAWQRWLGL